jgi:DNA-binding response OmpR family regulator
MGDKIGLVVTDHFLPERTGADLVREMRLTMPLIPVLVLSGMPGIESEYEGMNVSVRMKPIAPEEFIRFTQENVGA